MFQPTQIMEAALARRLRAQLIRENAFTVVLGDTGGVTIYKANKILGIWRWTGNLFTFSRSVKGAVEATAQILMGASELTSKLLF